MEFYVIMNKEQETIFAKLDEIKRDIAGGAVSNYTKNSFAEDEYIEVFETFHDSDKKQMHKLFWHNHKTGACGYREYTEEGPEKQTMDYYPDGQLTVCRYQKGKCYDEIGYKNGLLNGPYIRKISDRLLEEGSYTDGKKNPITHKIEFYENGCLKEATDYYNDIKDGQSFTFYPNGSRREELKFDDGRKISYCKSYYPNGTLKEDAYYSKGYRNGYCYTFREDGTKIREAHYKNGELEGVCSDYDDQNRLTQLCHYKAGTMHGAVESYDKDGTMISRTVYVNGRKVTPPNLSLSGRLRTFDSVMSPVGSAAPSKSPQEHIPFPPRSINSGR